MAKKVSLKGKKLYATYASLNSYAKNKKAKIARHLKRQPDDEKASQVLKGLTGQTKPTRKTPNSKNGWVNRANERFAKLTKSEAKALAKVVKIEKVVRNEGGYMRSVQDFLTMLNKPDNKKK